MKKILSILTVLCICGISAFAQNTAPKENIMKDKKVLVAFFSRTGENYNVGNISKSNTHIIAEMIAGETNGKLFQIEPVKPYPDEYRACVDIAKTEKENKARPAVKEDIAAEDYDVIFLGYPNWWGDMPMAVYTFINAYNMYMWPLLVTGTEEMRTVQIGISMLNSVDSQSITMVIAGVVMVILPSLFVFILGQKQLIRGMFSGAVKG